MSVFDSLQDKIFCDSIKTCKGTMWGEEKENSNEQGVVGIGGKS